MPRYHVVNECPIVRTFRVEQLAGMFDVPIEAKSTSVFDAEVPGMDEDWQIGLIVGPSGSGKTSLARKAFGPEILIKPTWAGDKAVVDCFGDRPIKEVTAMLSSVGFSSPPAWLRPYWALSNGEQFRCDVARLLAESNGLAVIDEFTSVVDRTVAKIGSAAVSKAVRRTPGRRLVAVSCHYDIADWLEPDWVVDMATCQLARGRLCRPKIELSVARVKQEAWRLFARHHYLASNINPSSTCFGAFHKDSLVAICAVLSFPHPTHPGWREHRTVVLPDYQGVGIGTKLSEFVAAIYKSTGRPYRVRSSHPAVCWHRKKSPLWRCIAGFGYTRKQNGTRLSLNKTAAVTRPTASFQYIGPSNTEDAKRLGIIP